MRNRSLLATVPFTLLLLTACGCKRSATFDTPPAHVQAKSNGPVAATPPPAANTPTAAPLPPALVDAGGLRPLFAGLDARRHFDASKWAEAARGFTAWIDAHPGRKDLHRARFLRHFSEHRAGLYRSALSGLAALAESGGLLADHERLWAAEAATLAKEPARVVELLDGIVDPRFVRRDRVLVLRARAFASMGQTDKATATWRELLHWIKEPGSDVLLEAGVALAAAGDVKRAADALRSIRVRFPGSRAETAAVDHLGRLPDGHAALSRAERLRRMSAARRMHRREIALAEAATIKAQRRVGSSDWCAAALTEARVVESFFNRRPEAMRLYGQAVKRCPKTPAWAKLWYRAGRRQNSSGTASEARALFGMVLKYAPKTTLVDDALRWQARIERHAGRHAQADALLRQAINHGGDMGEYASWDLVWHHYKSRRFAKAAAAAQVALDAKRKPSRAYNGGRLRYWLGRAEARRGRKGRAKAIAAWAQVVREHPLTWYGWLARLRLKAIAPKLAESAWREAQRQRKVPALLAANAGLLSDRHLLAGIELMRLGLTTSAARELGRVPWKRLAKRGKKEASAEPLMLQALLHHAVGKHNTGTSLASRDRQFARYWPAGENLERWRLAYPRPAGFAQAVDSAAAKSGVDPSFVWSIMRSESRFNPRIQSPVLATGLLQLMLPTGRKMAKHMGEPGPITHQTLKQPALNIRLGVGYMARLLRRVKGQYPLVASGYNAGPHNTNKWLKKRGNMQLDEFVEAIPFRENRRYVKSVLTSTLRYATLYADGAAPKLPLELPAPR